MPGWCKPIFSRRVHHFTLPIGRSDCCTKTRSRGDKTKLEPAENFDPADLCKLCLREMVVRQKRVARMAARVRKPKPPRKRRRLKKVGGRRATKMEIILHTATPPANPNKRPVMERIGPCETPGCATKFTQYKNPDTGKRCCLRCLTGG